LLASDDGGIKGNKISTVVFFSKINRPPTLGVELFPDSAQCLSSAPGRSGLKNFLGVIHRLKKVTVFIAQESAVG